MPACTIPALVGQWLGPRRRLFVASAMSILCVSPAAPQGRADWVFQSPDGARAFYAVLADLPVSAVGPFPFYRRASGRQAPASLRDAVTGPRFEVLHFVPLYAPNLDAAGLAAALRAASNGVARPAPGAAFLDATLRATLPADDRTVLSALATLVEGAGARLPPAHPRLATLQSRWGSAFAPALRRFLEDERLTSGVVLLSESLGPEGRIFTGRPAEPGDNVIAVGPWPEAASPDAPLLAMLRELCFPLVTRTIRPASGEDRAAASARSAFAAVRCGARLADAVSPATGGAYRAMWAAAGPHPEVGFDAQYPADGVLPTAVLAAVSRSLARSSPH